MFSQLINNALQNILDQPPHQQSRQSKRVVSAKPIGQAGPHRNIPDNIANDHNIYSIIQQEGKKSRNVSSPIPTTPRYNQPINSSNVPTTINHPVQNNHSSGLTQEKASAVLPHYNHQVKQQKAQPVLQNQQKRELSVPSSHILPNNTPVASSRQSPIEYAPHVLPQSANLPKSSTIRAQPVHNLTDHHPSPQKIPTTATLEPPSANLEQTSPSSPVDDMSVVVIDVVHHERPIHQKMDDNVLTLPPTEQPKQHPQPQPHIASLHQNMLLSAARHQAVQAAALSSSVPPSASVVPPPSASVSPPKAPVSPSNDDPLTSLTTGLVLTAIDNSDEDDNRPNQKLFEDLQRNEDGNEMIVSSSKIYKSNITGITKPSRMAKLKSILTSGATDELTNVKINSSFRYKEPKHLPGAANPRAIRDLVAEDDDITLKKKSKNIQPPPSSSQLSGKQRVLSAIEQQKRQTQEEDIVLTDMTKILQHLNTNSQTVQTQLHTQKELLTENQQLASQTSDWFSSVDTHLEQTLRNTPCNKFNIILFQAMIVVILLLIIVL